MSYSTYHAVSRVSDGNMKGLYDDPAVQYSRRKFLDRYDMSLEQSVLVRFNYDSDDFCRYQVVDASKRGEGMSKPSTIIADALFTKEKNLTLFLRLADCIGMVIYDKNSTAIGLSHIGRHNLEQYGATKTIHYFSEQFGVEPSDIHVHLGPTVAKDHYQIYKFANKGMHECAFEQLAEAGVVRQHITVDERDSATDVDLFSHSQFLKGKQATDGRHAMVVTMK